MVLKKYVFRLLLKHSKLSAGKLLQMTGAAYEKRTLAKSVVVALGRIGAAARGCLTSIVYPSLLSPSIAPPLFHSKLKTYLFLQVIVSVTLRINFPYSITIFGLNQLVYLSVFSLLAIYFRSACLT